MNFYDVLVFMILNKVLMLLFLMVVLYVEIIWVLYFLIGIKKNEFVLIDIYLIVCRRIMILMNKYFGY